MIEILLALLLYPRLDTTKDYKSLQFEPPVSSYVVVNKISQSPNPCDLNVIECDNQEEWQKGEFSAYSSGDGFTPSNTMANGERVYEGAVACPNGYKFGDQIEIEGLGVYTCCDRMAKRYRTKKNFDLYFNDIGQAKQFGRQKLNFKIIE